MSEVKQKWITWSKDNGCYCGLYDDGDTVGNDARLEFAGFEAGYRKQQKRIDELQKRINKAKRPHIFLKDLKVRLRCAHMILKKHYEVSMTFKTGDLVQIDRGKNCFRKSIG